MQKYRVGIAEGNEIALTSKAAHAAGVGNQHATIYQEDGHLTVETNDFALYKVYVDGYQVRRKRLAPDSVLGLGKGRKILVRLREYFEFNTDGTVEKLRRPHDFTSDLMKLKGEWKSRREIENYWTLRRNALILGVILALALVTYLVAHNATLALLVGSIGGGAMFLFNRTIFDRFRQRTKDEIDARKKVQVCPKCGESLLEHTWSDLKSKGGHECGARWELQ